MFGLFKKKKPKNALDELIFTIYGNPPPKKRADLSHAIDLAYDNLLLENIDRNMVAEKAEGLHAGPIPYSTHDLALSVALGFFRDQEYISTLTNVQVLARLQALEWFQNGLVAPMLMSSFEKTLYEVYKS